jgi:hypothetical protein
VQFGIVQVKRNGGTAGGGVRNSCHINVRNCSLLAVQKENEVLAD